MIYAVMALKQDGKLSVSVSEHQKTKSTFELYSPRVWFVDFDGTTEELRNLIWPDGEENSSTVGPGCTVPINDYGGFASRDLWGWLKEREK